MRHSLSLSQCWAWDQQAQALQKEMLEVLEKVVSEPPENAAQDSGAYPLKARDGAGHKESV